jgi:hypothetical protein
MNGGEKGIVEVWRKLSLDIMYELNECESRVR